MKTSFIVSVLVLFTLFFLASCDILGEDPETPNVGIVGVWKINGTFQYYMDDPPNTSAHTLIQTNIFSADNTFSISGTSQWEGQSAQTMEATGTYSFNEATGALHLSYTTFLMDGQPGNGGLPPAQNCVCVIDDDIMTCTFPPNIMYSPAEPIIMTRQ